MAGVDAGIRKIREAFPDHNVEVYWGDDFEDCAARTVLVIDGKIIKSRWNFEAIIEEYDVVVELIKEIRTQLNSLANP